MSAANAIGRSTYYVRDASGNVMSVYAKEADVNSGNLTQTELHLYGISRLGVYNVNTDVQCPTTAPEITIFTRGNKFFELTNHLGNVLVTISDKKIAHNNGSNMIDYYNADVVTAQDYYPFGMGIPGREYHAGSSSYRYSINGQEKESDLNKNITTAQYWEYDSRIGRRWNKDPIVKDDESPYLCFGGNPVAMVDPDGSDWYKDTKGADKGQIRWFDGSGKHKGYNDVGATYNGYTNEGGNNKWMNGDANGKKTIWQDPVIIYSGKKKEDNSLMGRSLAIDHKEYKEYKSGLNQFLERAWNNQPIWQKGDNLSYVRHINAYNNYLKSYNDWKSTQMAVFVDLPLLFVPVPKVGMLRWLKPFGSGTGRVFWSGGGLTGEAFAEATEHAFLYGGTTLERTLTGKSITIIQSITGRNAMTGRLWNWASTQFAKGAIGDVHVFLGTIRTDAFWYTEKAILESSNKVTQIIPHIVP